MDILAFVDKAIRVEETIADCYGALSKQCDPAYSASLAKLSAEELKHRNILNIARTFVLGAPDLFGRVILPEEDLENGRRALGPLLEAIAGGGGDWWDNLARLCDLEVDLERVHLAVSVVIRDPSLRALFRALAAGDENHGCVVSGILSEAAGFRAAGQQEGAVSSL